MSTITKPEELAWNLAIERSAQEAEREISGLEEHWPSCADAVKHIPEQIRALKYREVNA